MEPVEGLPHMDRYRDKTVVVTGAASGIGAATARRLHAEGARVVAIDRNLADLKATQEGLDSPERIHAAALDVTDTAGSAEVVAEAAARFGDLHGLANCAGVRGVGSILDIEPAELEQVLSVNLAGTLFLCQAFARAPFGGDGQRAIVNVSSAAGIRAVPNRLAYVASKFGVIGATQTAALELAPLGIRVNAVAPGMIRTPMTATMFADPANVERIAASHPIGRAGETEEIAAAIAFLLSDDASFVVGAVLPVDGGNTVGIPSFGGRD
jgi:meso-butanediol dehydrogenase/(S,S)-butanediol dehydrogenase/diacetyl reductase